MALNTCALYGASNYANNWLGINLLVILTSIAIVTFVYTLSKFLPDKTRSKIGDMTKAELTISFFSAVLLIALIALSQVVCSASLNISHSLLQHTSLPTSETSLPPFEFAVYYSGTLASQTGIGLLTQLYDTSIRYGVISQLMDDAGQLIFQTLDIGPSATAEAKSLTTGTSVTLDLTSSGEIGVPLKQISDVLINLLSVLVSIALGVAFIQYLAVPLVKYTAFTVILPVALAMRSISFSGHGLRSTANAFIAIAIAGYIIFPMTLMFDSYVMTWTFSSANPAYPYLQITQTSLQTNSNTYFSAWSSSTSAQNNALGLLGSAFGVKNGDFVSLIVNVVGAVANPYTVISQLQDIANQVAQFIFQSTVLFALNAAITIGFAISFAKSLDAGITGASSFWSNL